MVAAFYPSDSAPAEPTVALVANAAPGKPRRVINRLILVPGGAEEGGCILKELIALAKGADETEEVYIYVAVAGQQTVEDNETGVRFLPLRGEGLPCFGALESVLVFNDTQIAAEAATEYPMANVRHLKPGPSA